MSRTYRILLVAVVALGAVGGYWKLVLAPKREQIAQLDEQVAAEQAQLAQTQQLIATYQGARDAYKVNYDTVVRLGKAVPTDDDTRSLVVQLDAAAKRSGIDFDTVNVNGGGGRRAATARTVAPGRDQRRRVLGDAVHLNFTRPVLHAGRLLLAARALRDRSRATRSPSAAACCASRASACSRATDGWPAPERPGRRQLLHRPRGDRPGRRRCRRGLDRHVDTTAATTTTTTTTGRRRAMNALTDPFKALWQRKLWPVAVLLVGALVAVPMVLAKEPVPAPAPANAQAKADEGLPATFVAAAEPAEDGERRRVLGEPKDPFAPAELSAKAKAARKKAAAKEKAAEEKAKAGARARPTPTRPRPAAARPRRLGRHPAGQRGAHARPDVPEVLDQGPLRLDRRRAGRPRRSSASRSCRPRMPRCSCTAASRTAARSRSSSSPVRSSPSATASASPTPRTARSSSCAPARPSS